MSKHGGKNKRCGRRKNDEPESEETSSLTTSMVWSGKITKVNTLTVKDTFDPTVPIDQPGDKGDDPIIWADVPAALKERLRNNPQQITQECLKMNVESGGSVVDVRERHSVTRNPSTSTQRFHV